MPRRNVQFIEGEYYHIYNRGALRNLLFANDAYYHLFAQFLDRYGTECRISVIGICLMPNHFHLLIRVDEGGDV